MKGKNKLTEDLSHTYKRACIELYSNVGIEYEEEFGVLRIAYYEIDDVIKMLQRAKKRGEKQ